MPLLNERTAAYGKLTIATVALESKCFWTLNFPVLFGASSVRGSDVVIPHLAGVKARRRRVTATEYQLEMLVAGDRDASGSTFSVYSQGIESNCNVLLGLVDPPATTAGTRSATVTWPSAATSTKDIHVLNFTPGQMVNPGVIRATLLISSPSGRF